LGARGPTDYSSGNLPVCERCIIVLVAMHLVNKVAFDRARPSLYRRYRLIYSYEGPGQKSAVTTHVSFLLLLARPIRDAATSFRRFRQTEASCVEYRYEVTLHLMIHSTLKLPSSRRPIPFKAKVTYNHVFLNFAIIKVILF
jgi:hypothetical protein